MSVLRVIWLKCMCGIRDTGNTLQHTATHCNTLQHTATHCNTLQHTATHCNTLQHTDPRDLTSRYIVSPCVWIDSFIMRNRTHLCVRHEFTSKHHVSSACDMTHSYVQRNSFVCATWLICMCDMTHSYVRHYSFVCVTWLIHTCDMIHSYVRHHSFVCVTWLIRCAIWIIQCVTRLIYARHDLFIYESSCWHHNMTI